MSSKQQQHGVREEVPAEVLLAAVAQQRDREAFAALFQRFGPRLLTFLMRAGCSAVTAEELVQETMLTLWRVAERYDPAQASVSTWLYTIARNKRIDALRREQRPELDPDDPSLQPSSFLDGDAQTRSSEREKRVREALRHLPKDQVELLQLSFFAGKTHRDIADELRLPVGTVKSRMSRAFEKLRSILQDQDEE